MAKWERCCRGSTAGAPRGAAEELLRRGADVSLQTNSGGSALSLAASNDREKLVELALRHGAEVNQHVARGPARRAA